MAANLASQSVPFTVINILVLISTLFRLSFRLRIRRFWWEDAWAAVAFISGTVFVVAQYISVETTNPETGFITGWISSVFSTIAMCAVRMSILYSTIRIMSPSRIRIMSPSRIRTFARIVAIFLFIFCATSVTLRSSLCQIPIMPRSGGAPRVTRQCLSSLILVVFQMSTDCISDAILVFLPLKLLWRIKLPQRQHRMILTSFSSSAIVSIFSLARGILLTIDTPHTNLPNVNLPDNSPPPPPPPTPNDNFGFNLTLNLETTSALIVCNLLVLVTYMYRLFRKSRGESVSSESDDSSAGDDFTTRKPSGRTTQALTTLDLDIDASYGNLSSGVSSLSHPSSAAAGKNDR